MEDSYTIEHENALCENISQISMKEDEYEVDVSDISSTISNINKFILIHPKFFKTNVDKKLIYHNNQINTVFNEPVVFNDKIHRVSGKIITSYDDEKYYMKVIVKNKRKTDDCYVKRIEDYINYQTKHGQTVQLHYFKILNDTIIKHCFYNESIIKWAEDVETLKNEFFLSNKDYLLSIMENKTNDSAIGSKTNTWNNLILTGKPGTGKCFAYNTPILMFDGLIKPVQDIAVGDLLMGDDSTPRRVLETCRGMEKMYKIKQGDDTYIVNESHILSLIYDEEKTLVHLQDSNSFLVTWFDKDDLTMNERYFDYGHDLTYRKVKKEAYNFFNSISDDRRVDISMRQYLSLPREHAKKLKGYRVFVDYPDKELRVDPYIMGIWLGLVETSLGFYPKKILVNFMKKCVINNCKVNFVMLKKLIGIITEKGVDNSILHYIEGGRKRIHNDFIINSKKNRLQLLAGLIDSTGEYNSEVYILKNLDKVLANDIIVLCKSLGFGTSYYSGQLFIRGNIHWVPSLFYKCEPAEDEPYLLETINVLPRKQDNYFGFTLDKNSRFLLGNYIVTHNSSFVYRISVMLKLSILSVDLSLYLNKKKELYSMFHGQDFSLPNSKDKEKEGAINNAVIILEEFDHAIDKLLDIENIFKYKDILKRNYLKLKNNELKIKSADLAAEEKDVEINMDDVNTYEDYMNKLMNAESADIYNKVSFEVSKKNMIQQRDHDNEMNMINIALNNLIKSMDEDNRSNILRLSDMLELFQGPIPVKGRIIVATTNNFEKIKNAMPALFRAGRMSVVHFDYLDWASLNNLTKYYFDKNMTVDPFEITIPTSEIIELAIKHLICKKDFIEFERELYSLCMQRHES